MSTPAVPQRPFLDSLFGAFWPEESLAGSPRLLAASLATGALAAVVLPFRDLGLGTFLVVLVAVAVVASADRRLRTPFHLTSLALCVLLTATLVVRDAEWVVVLCVLAAAGLAIATLTEGRSLLGLLVAGLALPLAGLRGLPWLGRSATTAHGRVTWAPVLRTAAITLLLLIVFGLLFASADALFARWAGAVVPDITAPTLVLRAFVTVFVGGLTLAAVYVALNPPRVETLALPEGRPVRRPFEWLLPVGGVTVLFGVFVVAQLAVMFGGHAYLRRTTGLTYAEYVHQGFGQLTATTVLTLLVVGVAARKAPKGTARERLLLRAVLGVLCALTLVVVASALYRMHVYEEAYGFTRLRLLVSFFEGWLGLVVLLVVVAGVGLRGWWVPRAVILTGAGALLLLAAVNPDAMIARANLDRYEQTGKVDAVYLSGLSADATRVLAGTGCEALPAPETDWLEWNLGRARAHVEGSRARIAGCPPG